MGPPGVSGEKGERGEPGAIGADGSPGRDGLDGRPGEKGLDGVPGRDGLDGRPGEKGLDGAPGAPGRDIDEGAVLGLLEKAAHEAALRIVPSVVIPQLAESVKALPLPKDGVPGRDGRDGASVTIADLLPLIETRIAAGIAEAVKALPPPMPGRDGLSVTIEDLRPVVLELVAAEIAARPARDGRDGLPGVPGPAGEKGLDGINGKDGIDGRPGEKGADGADGLGINNAAMTFDETKGYALVMSNGERSFEMRLPQGWDAGVWRQGRQYPKGCNVTFKGDQWTAQVDTVNRPGDTPDWRLAVRRGRDGKDLRDAG
jgi:hypothetical protein